MKAMKRPDGESVLSTSATSLTNGKKYGIGSPTRKLLSPPLRKSLGPQHLKRRKERLLIKRALEIKSRSSPVVNGTEPAASPEQRPDVRVLPKRKCDKDRGSRTTRMWLSEPAADETRKIKVICSSLGAAAVFQRLEDEKAERSRFVTFGCRPNEEKSPDFSMEGAAASSKRSSETNVPDSMVAAFPPTSTLLLNGTTVSDVGVSSHIKRGLEHDRRRKTDDFKKMARLSKFIHRVSTFVSATKIYHNKMWWHTGDIVSVTGEDLRKYYAQTRGYFCDQYGTKSCVFTWLVPKKSSKPVPSVTRDAADEFDPCNFVIGFDDDEPRMLSELTWVCRAPSDYYRPKNAPYETATTSRRAGFVWTRTGPVEASLDELEKARSEKSAIKRLDVTAGPSGQVMGLRRETAPRKTQSSAEVIQERVIELLIRKNLESKAAENDGQSSMDLGEVAVIEPCPESGNGEELCVMTRGTLNALLEKKTENYSNLLESQLRALLRVDTIPVEPSKDSSKADAHWALCTENLESLDDSGDQDDRKADVDVETETESGIEEDRSGDSITSSFDPPAFLADHTYCRPHRAVRTN